jgi:transcriptional regulator with XRE-family HTH domain
MKLAELRKARGLSQRGLAAAADISKSKIERLEYGENKIADISLSLAKRLADALGITMEDLLKLE